MPLRGEGGGHSRQFGCAAKTFKPQFTLLRQKSIISLSCLRKETSFNDNVSFSLAYRINQFFFHGIRVTFGKEKLVRYRNCKLAHRQPSPSLKGFRFAKTPCSIQDAVVKLYTLFKSQDHENYTLLSDINPTKKGNNPPVCPLLCFCVKLP